MHMGKYVPYDNIELDKTKIIVAFIECIAHVSTYILNVTECFSFFRINIIIHLFNDLII